MPEPAPDIQAPDPRRSDHLPADDPILPDPLLESGTFIDVDSHLFENGNVEDTPMPLRAVAGSEPEPIVEPGVDLTDTPTSQRKTKRPPEGMAERPSWLPENWKVELRTRISGATAGSIDRYYIEPGSGRKFRSKKEVDYFLETGSKRKRKPNSDATLPENSEVHKPKKSKRRIGDFSGLNFDFRNPPQTLSWTLTSASQDKWMPFAAEGLIPEPVKRDWDDAFSCITQLGGNSSKAN